MTVGITSISASAVSYWDIDYTYGAPSQYSNQSTSVSLFPQQNMQITGKCTAYSQSTGYVSSELRRTYGFDTNTVLASRPIYGKQDITLGNINSIVTTKKYTITLWAVNCGNRSEVSGYYK